MTEGEHRERHKQLHRYLDELVACWISSQPEVRLSQSSVMELIRWSHEQTCQATPIGSDSHA